MTEQEWRTCTDPKPMLEFIRGKASGRKETLFDVACCRVIWHLLPEERSRKVVVILERLADEPATFVDGLVGNVEWGHARREARLAKMEFRQIAKTKLEEARGEALPLVREAFTLAVAAEAADFSGIKGGFAGGFRDDRGLYPEHFTRLANEAHKEVFVGRGDLFREIFGNPFRPVTVDPAWLTSDVVALAEGIYQDRAFDRMSILADALQDAGCDNEDILNHCRGEEPHVRGCWVVDLLTGRK